MLPIEDQESTKHDADEKKPVRPRRTTKKLDNRSISEKIRDYTIPDQQAMAGGRGGHSDLEPKVK